MVLTKLTFKTFLATMVSHMQNEFVVPVERFSAGGTSERFLPSVCPVMSFQVFHVRSPVPAVLVVTRELLLWGCFGSDTWFDIC